MSIDQATNRNIEANIISHSSVIRQRASIRVVKHKWYRLDSSITFIDLFNLQANDVWASTR